MNHADYQIPCEGAGFPGNGSSCQMCGRWFPCSYKVIPVHDRLDILRMVNDGGFR